MAEHVVLHKRFLYFRTLIVFNGGKESGSQHSVCRLTGSGQIQCTSRGNFASFTSSVMIALHVTQGGGEIGGNGVKLGAPALVFDPIVASAA